MTGVGATMPGGTRKTGTMIPAKTWGTCMTKSRIPPAMSVCGRSSRVKNRTEFQAFFLQQKSRGVLPPGSGNTIRNLRMVAFLQETSFSDSQPFSSPVFPTAAR